MMLQIIEGLFDTAAATDHGIINDGTTAYWGGRSSSFFLPHEHLPAPFNAWVARYVLLEGVEHAETYLITLCVILISLVFIQLKAFTRPPPVPLKRLPTRPVLQVLFKPDDVVAGVSSSSATTAAAAAAGAASATTTSKTVPSTTAGTTTHDGGTTHDYDDDDDDDSAAVVGDDDDWVVDGDADDDHHSDPLLRQQDSSASRSRRKANSSSVASSGTDEQQSNWYSAGSQQKPATTTTDAQPQHHHHHHHETSQTPRHNNIFDLPDSFAPLLSSGNVEILRQQLTADLVHAVDAEASLRIGRGRHEIPLNKDRARPQLLLDVPDGGCRLSAVAKVGSDGFSSAQDLDVNQPTASRSKPMVKHAALVFDPPLPLANVAPTLIQLPTLFEDNFVPIIRQIQIVRLAVDFIISISSFLERMLWIIESKCQIHLSKVRIIPVYKGADKESSNNNNKAPQWRLTLAFSGHVLLFGWIPIPFITVTLPTFIIPQPHALLDYLMSAQPLASAKLRRENIAEHAIALALIETAETWTASCRVVATPPAVGVETRLSGGAAIAVELELGRDTTGASNKGPPDAQQQPQQQPSTAVPHQPSDNSMSSWTTHPDTRPYGSSNLNASMSRNNNSTGRFDKTAPGFDANEQVPWSFECSLKGTISHDKMSVHVLKMLALHVDVNDSKPLKSKFSTRGSFAVWKITPEKAASGSVGMGGPLALRRAASGASFHGRKSNHHPALVTEDTPSVAAVLLFPDDTASFHSELRLLQYDYAFDVFEDTKIDAVTLSVGAGHTMLSGGTMVSVILDAIFAYGSVSAREDAILDPAERKRKRNILRHLPALDISFGIQNIYIPPESSSYSDDGQTLFLPDVSGGRMMARCIGGIDTSEESSLGSGVAPEPGETIIDGVKLVADFEIASVGMTTDEAVKEFPELDIFDGVRLRTLLSGGVGGSIRAHLQPQQLNASMNSTGPNIFNPLEAYEIDFSGSALSLKIKEFNAVLGHRRVIFPAESSFDVKVIQSVVDMGFEGKTQCELGWDFNGLSPILQVTTLGHSAEDAEPENREQVSLLVGPLRQGRLSFHVSPVGGIDIRGAATSREHKEGLFDWKFFNALVSPDGSSMERMLDVLQDKRTTNKLLQIAKLLNDDLHKILKFAIRQVLRVKEILDEEGIEEPKDFIPIYKLSRLICLILTGDTEQIEDVLPLVGGAVAGDGLDIVKTKELIRKNLPEFDEWAPEIDRGLRCAAVFLAPMASPQPYVEDNVIPLAEMPSHAAMLKEIPSAGQLYEAVLHKMQLPLDPSFSSLVSRVAPYLSFRQIEYFLQVRPSTHWGPSDLRRIRYVYSIKKKVLEIAESYGGLSFLPQSFLVSVFLGEATRTSHRASRALGKKSSLNAASDISKRSRNPLSPRSVNKKLSTLARLRRRRTAAASQLERVHESQDEYIVSPAERIAAATFVVDPRRTPGNFVVQMVNESSSASPDDSYELGDSLLGPQDVAILLQAGLTSVMKSSSVVQLNQRMLLDLICSQPRSFAVAVLAEIGTPGGQGSPRGLTSALMALLELDQTAFKDNHRIDMHALLESWLPGLTIPRRDDYMAGGRWARQSYYEALYAVATSILDDAEAYIALKGHVQRVRRHVETDPIPQPLVDEDDRSSKDQSPSLDSPIEGCSQLKELIEIAKALISEADAAGRAVLPLLFENDLEAKHTDEYKKAISLYEQAFEACASVLKIDRHSFQATWFRDFYKRNYDALLIKSMYDNVVDDTDNVRYWLNALRSGAARKDLAEKLFAKDENLADGAPTVPGSPASAISGNSGGGCASPGNGLPDHLFLEADIVREQMLVDAIIDAIIYEKPQREKLRADPLVRLLIPNPDGKYDFAIVSAMGVVTEGKKGFELEDAFKRLEEKRGVQVIRADTATARSFDYNAAKIEDAIQQAVEMNKPYGLIGYSQGCPNALMAESNLLSGTPKQLETLVRPKGGGLVCRQLLFSAANGSFHALPTEKKIARMIVMTEEFFKYQQGYCSRAVASVVINLVSMVLDSPDFHKTMGCAQTFLPDGVRSYWREAQHLAHVPTCTLKGVMEEHTTPECLEMVSHLLAKQSGSALHDSQVHVFDAVGYPVYHNNRNGRLMKRCAVGECAIQRTHHWSPLGEKDVGFVKTQKDIDKASYDCAKDRHVFPWVDVNARFGFIKYSSKAPKAKMALAGDVHPSKLVPDEILAKASEVTA